MASLLLIDSDDFSSQNIKNWLQNEGYLVDICRSGSAGLRQLQKSAYDLAVVAWELPDANGVDICRRVCASNLRLPILLLGERESSEDAVSGLDAGAQDFMSKPCPLPELSARLRSLLRRYGGSRVVLPSVPAPVNPAVIPY